jgi:hypothetical protein
VFKKASDQLTVFQHLNFFRGFASNDQKDIANSSHHKTRYLGTWKIDAVTLHILQLCESSKKYSKGTHLAKFFPSLLESCYGKKNISITINLY